MEGLVESCTGVEPDLEAQASSPGIQSTVECPRLVLDCGLELQPLPGPVSAFSSIQLNHPFPSGMAGQPGPSPQRPQLPPHIDLQLYEGDRPYLLIALLYLYDLILEQVSPTGQSQTPEFIRGTKRLLESY